jgi:hypothetical protein
MGIPLALRQIADFNLPPLPRGSYASCPDAEEKDFVNQAVNRLFKKVVSRKQGFAIVLDAEDCRTTRSMLRQLGAGVRVVIPQKDPRAHEAMSRCTSHLKNLHSLHLCSAGEVNGLLPTASVVLDHADFCSTWTTEGNVICDRLERAVYAPVALLRVTVCGRNREKTDLDTIDAMTRDLKRAAYLGGYTVKPMKLREWAKHPSVNPHKDAVAYVHGTRTINMVFIVVMKTKLRKAATALTMMKENRTPSP